MKKKAFDLLTLGEILLRLSPPDNERIVRGETFQKQVGGAELNVASGVSLLGLRSGIISRIPDSSIGMFGKFKDVFCHRSIYFSTRKTQKKRISRVFEVIFFRAVYIRVVREFASLYYGSSSQGLPQGYTSNDSPVVDMFRIILLIYHVV